jgi:hypothetical protein
MARRSASGFPKLREQLEIMTRLYGQGLQLFSQSVRQYLIEGPELFTVVRLCLAGAVSERVGEKFMARRSASGFPKLREQLEIILFSSLFGSI